MKIDIEKLLNEVAENKNDLNETIENLVKSIVSQSDSFNPQAIPREYDARQKHQKRPVEYKIDIEKLKRLLSAYKSGQKFSDPFYTATRVVAGNMDIIDNIEEYIEKIYNLEVDKKYDTSKENKRKEEKLSSAKINVDVTVHENRRGAEDRFIQLLKILLHKKYEIRHQEKERFIRLMPSGFSYGKKLKEIENSINLKNKQEDELAENLFNEFAEQLKNILKEKTLSKTDLIVINKKTGKSHIFEIKENSGGKIEGIKYSQQYRISHRDTFKGITDEDKVIEVFEKSIIKLLKSEILGALTQKINQDKSDLLTRIGKNVVVVKKNEYDIYPILAISETRTSSGKKIPYILFKIKIHKTHSIDSFFGENNNK